MKKNLIRLKKKRVDPNGMEHWEVYITPSNVKCIDPGVRDLELTCEYDLNSRFIARIRKHPRTFKNGARWAITPNHADADRYFEEFGEIVGISLEKVKAIMNVVMRRAFENHEFGTFQDGILLNI